MLPSIIYNKIYHTMYMYFCFSFPLNIAFWEFNQNNILRKIYYLKKK